MRGGPVRFFCFVFPLMTVGVFRFELDICCLYFFGWLVFYTLLDTLS